MLDQSFIQIADELFSIISPFKSNSEILRQTVEIERLRKEVVSRLAKIEKDNLPSFWWEDIELLGIFNSLYTCGIIFLPRDVVERMRWIALVYVAMCEIEEFSYGNVLIPPDFLPDKELTEYVSIYGSGVIEDIQSFREDVASEGWERFIS